MEMEMREWSINGFVEVLISISLKEGISSCLQTSGIGMLRPNTIFIGMCSEKQIADIAFINDYMRKDRKKRK